MRHYLDPDLAEAKDAFLAMDFVCKRGWRKVIIQRDSSVVVATLSRDQEDSSSFANIVADIHASPSVLDQFSIYHIQGCGNLDAHEVARPSLKGPHSFTFLPDVYPTKCNILCNFLNKIVLI